MVHRGVFNVSVVLPAWLKRSHGSLHTVYSQQPGITLYYVEHHDSQKTMIIGLTRGFSSLTQSQHMRMRVYVHMHTPCNIL